MISKPQRPSSDSVAKAKTAGLLNRADDVLAGRADDLVQRPLTDSTGYTFPFLVDRAEGCWVIDSMGRSFIDWTSGNGCSILGYNRPELKAVVERQMNCGPVLPLAHSLEIQVAELLVELVPCAEQVAFAGDYRAVLELAVQIAKLKTDRNTILCCGDVAFENRLANIIDVGTELITFPLNDSTALDKLARQHDGKIAAIVMQPIAREMPHEGTLERIRKLSLDKECLLIFDESWTAFRLASGGAQDYFGVVPDLACVGSGMANGMPVAAVVGSSDIMQHYSAVCSNPRFRVDNFTLAIARFVLTKLKIQPIYDHISSIGLRLKTRLCELSQEIGVRCDLTGPDVRMEFVFPECGDLDINEVRKLFFRECIKGGVLISRYLYPNLAHDERTIEMTVSAIASALKKVGGAIESGSIDFEQSTVQAEFNGYLESLDREYEALKVCGWLLLQDGPADEIEVVSAAGESVKARVRERSDIKDAFPDRERAEHAGFEVILPDGQFYQDDHYEFTIKAKRNGEVLCESLVVKQTELPPESAGPYSMKAEAIYI